jgi:Flp pilus assembly protein TadD
MTLEFSAPRELHNQRAGENGATLRTLLKDGGPTVVRNARRSAGAVEWRHRAEMLVKADVHAQAYDDFARALEMDPVDAAALDGFVRTAIMLRRAADGVMRLTTETSGIKTPERLAAVSRLLAADDKRDEAVAVAREAAVLQPTSPAGLDQLASLFADSGDTVQLDATVADLRRIAPNRAPTEYFAAVAAFLHGDANGAVASAHRAIALDPGYAPTYDLIGAAYTKLAQLDPAREAFKKSLSFDAHDSTAYENLGVLELTAGNRAMAARYFAEALWLVPESQTARQGLAQAKP